MSNQLTPMQDLLEDLKESKVTVIEALNDINNVSTREICKEVVTTTLNVIIGRIETELLPKEKQVHEEIWNDGNDNITYDELYGYDRLLSFKDYYNTKFKQNESK